MPDPDAALVDAAAGGDPAAFRALMERHQSRIYNLCLRMVGNPDDAADASQDAFLTVYRKLGSFRGESTFSTWLHRVAVNASYDLLRKRQRAPLLSIVDDRGEPADAGPPAPDHADETIGSIDAARSLAAVPEEFRVPLVLHDVQDVSVQEVAEILGIPVGTVKSRLHRGRVMLARAMGAGEPGAPGEASKRGIP